MQVRDMLSTELEEIVEEIVYAVTHEDDEDALEHVKTVLANNHLIEED